MDPSQQKALADLLSAYFSYQSLEKGVDELVFVTAVEDDYHRHVLATIESAHAAAVQGDPAVTPLVLDNIAEDAQTPAAAQTYIEHLRQTYLTRYREATAGG